MTLVDVSMRLLLLLERFLVDGLTGIVEQAFDVIAAVVVEQKFVAIAMMTCMDVTAVAVDANNIAV